MLQQEDNETKILIWGEAGVGKSTFCEKISQDWALVVTGREGTELDKLTEEQRRKLNNIGLLFCIVLRDTNSDQTLEQILRSQFKLLDSQLGKLKSYTDNVILILDGFDELSYNEGDLIRIIQGKFNQNVQCIVTCRPHASQGIVLRADSEIRLKGFSESQSKAFIEMFARNRFKKEKDIDLFISRTWKEITSSVDLLEMSTNPSMLQLVCLLSAQTGKIGKDRAEVFKHYTRYLLIQYHRKHHEGVSYSDKLYKDDLLKCGKLAMFGLKQNHLQLVFSKQEATEVAGSMIFDLGFLTELPSIDADKVKVQFIHKSLQEYLAAFYVVNTPGDEGMTLLMEFCSTSQKLMGSQIILSFITAMSTKMGKVIQNQIKDYISTWESNDDVDPKSRTSFLIAMLKDNKKITFPLPAILDIDLQVYDLVSKRIRNFLKSLFDQKSTLERFLIMDGRGVKKINIGVGQYNRLNLLLNNSFTSMEELLINYKNTSSEDDPKHLSKVITTNKPSLISITNCVDSLFNKDLITNAILTPHVHTVILKKCQICKDNCLLFLQRGHHLKSLIMQECGIEIDAEIAKAVCDLPDETNVDLLGNKIVKMDKKLLISLIYKIRKQKQIDLGVANIDIDSEIAKAVFDLPDETRIDLSGNKVVKTDIKILITLINKVRIESEIDLSGLYIRVGDREACVIWEIQDETHTDLCSNKIVEIDIKKFMSIIYKITKQKEIDLSRLNIDIDSEIAKAVCDLPGETQIDLSGNKIVKMDTKLLASLIVKINTQKQIDLSGLNIDIDSEIAKAVCDLPGETQIDLSGNKIVKMDTKLLASLIVKINTQKQIDLSGLNIDIDSEIAKAVCDLPDQTQIDLSGNKIVKMDKKLLISLIYKIRKQKQIDLSGLNIDIDSEIAKAVCDLPDETQIDLSGNKISRLDRIILGLIVSQIRKEKEINVTRFNFQVDSKLINAIHEIPGDRELDLSKNKIFQINPRILMTLIYKIQSMKEIDLSGLNINIDTELVKCVSELPEDVQIDLSDNKITDESLIVSIIKQSTKLKSVTMRNCGIEINKQIAEAVSELNIDTKLDLSGNKITRMEAGLLVKVLKYMKTQEKISIHDWRIRIDVDIVKALSNMVYLKSLGLSYNTLTPPACKCLSQSVRSLPQLEVLFLSGCGISNDDCVDLVSSLSKHCPRLGVLYLYNNHLSSGYSQVVDDVSKMNNLRKLELSRNPCMWDRKKREEIENRLKISNPHLKVYTSLW